MHHTHTALAHHHRGTTAPPPDTPQQQKQQPPPPTRSADPFRWLRLWIRWIFNFFIVLLSSIFVGTLLEGFYDFAKAGACMFVKSLGQIVPSTSLFFLSCARATRTHTHPPTPRPPHTRTPPAHTHTSREHSRFAAACRWPAVPAARANEV